MKKQMLLVFFVFVLISFVYSETIDLIDFNHKNENGPNTIVRFSNKLTNHAHLRFTTPNRSESNHQSQSTCTNSSTFQCFSETQLIDEPYFRVASVQYYPIVWWKHNASISLKKESANTLINANLNRFKQIIEQTLKDNDENNIHYTELVNQYPNSNLNSIPQPKINLFVFPEQSIGLSLIQDKKHIEDFCVEIGEIPNSNENENENIEEIIQNQNSTQIFYNPCHDYYENEIESNDLSSKESKLKLEAIYGMKSIVYLSCLALQNKVSLLVNLCEKVEKQNIINRNQKISNKSVKFYNTNILFDRFGNLVLKYHKQHLWKSEVFDISPRKDKNEIVFLPIENHFGKIETVPISSLVCFDMEFRSSLSNLIDQIPTDNIVSNTSNSQWKGENSSKTKMLNILIPTWWMNEIPQVSATHIQAGFSFQKHEEINVIAANTLLRGDKGGGIYSRKMTLVQAFDSTDYQQGDSVVLVADLPIYQRQKHLLNDNSFHQKQIDNSTIYQQTNIPQTIRHRHHLPTLNPHLETQVNETNSFDKYVINSNSEFACSLPAIPGLHKYGICKRLMNNIKLQSISINDKKGVDCTGLINLSNQQEFEWSKSTKSNSTNDNTLLSPVSRYVLFVANSSPNDIESYSISNNNTKHKNAIWVQSCHLIICQSSKTRSDWENNPYYNCDPNYDIADSDSNSDSDSNFSSNLTGDLQSQSDNKTSISTSKFSSQATLLVENINIRSSFDCQLFDQSTIFNPISSSNSNSTRNEIGQIFSMFSINNAQLPFLFPAKINQIKNQNTTDNGNKTCIWELEQQFKVDDPIYSAGLFANAAISKD